MATRTTLVDDIDGSDAARTLSFAFDGNNYKIELSEDNIEKFSSALAPYINSARPSQMLPVARTRGRGGSAALSRDDSVAIRAWANDNGVQVSARGRVPSKVVEAYLAAHA